MKVLLVSFVILFNFFGSNCVTVQTTVNENYRQGFPRDDYNALYPTQNHPKDPQDPIIRPCPNKDENYIRRVFTSTFNCQPVHGPVPDPYGTDTLDMEIPHTNLTFTINDAKVKGLSSGKIQEFYINKQTGRVILEVVFDSVIVFSPRSVISHYQKGKEPIETTDYSIIEFKSLSLTLVITNVGQEAWKDHVYAYLPDADMPYRFGPGFTDSKDIQVISNSKKLMADMALSVKEAFLTQGPLFMSVYLQSNICDFRRR